jgi:hypothetical protein
MRDHLHRFWFHWTDEAQPAYGLGGGLGCGVTALDVEDAKSLMTRVALNGEPLPAIAHVVEDVDVQTLDPGHVLPNMGDPSIRGVWFPRP